MSQPPELARSTSKICEHCQPLRHETNVLVLARLNLLHRLSDINLFLALASITYFAICLTLLLVTAWPVQHLVSGDVFHQLDFGSTFAFSIVEVLTLLYSPERRFTNPTLLRALMFFSVCSTFVALLLVLLNRAVFEVIAHNIDYVNDFTVALIDSLLVSTVVRSPAVHPGVDLKRGSVAQQCQAYGKQLAVMATFVPLMLSSAQILLYNCLGVDLRGHLLGEQAAHGVEFVFDCIASAISFWFCLDSKHLVDELTRQIMIAPDDVVVVIDPESSTSIHTADEVGGRSPYSRPGEPPARWHDHSHSHTTHAHDHVCSHDCEHHRLAKPTNPLTEFLLPHSAADPH